MKAIRSKSRLPPILLALLIIPALVASCGDDDPASPTDTGTATVQGTLTLPDPAPGREYIVLIDNDYDGDVHVALFQGECCDGTELSYSFSDVAPGTYFVYALVRLVSAPDAEPEDGDLYGIYGGSLSDMPPAPNVTVPTSGTVTVNLTMDTYCEGSEPAEGPVITWNTPGRIVHYNYSGGILVNATIFMTANCAGEDGEVKITACLHRGTSSGSVVGEATAVFPMIAGNSYGLTATLVVRAENEPYTYNDYTVVWSSPHAAVGRPVGFGMTDLWVQSISGPYLD